MAVMLMNSAMMPQSGTYRMRRITKKDFVDILKDAYRIGTLQSYIGYQENIDLIFEWTGIKVPFSREATRLTDYDQLLVMKLKYRLNDPSMKGKTRMTEDDFEFFLCDYKEGL